MSGNTIDLIISNALLSDGRTVDIYIDAGEIETLLPNGSTHYKKPKSIYEAAGKLVIPGAIDLNARFNIEQEDLNSLIRNALRNGTTTINFVSDPCFAFDMPEIIEDFKSMIDKELKDFQITFCVSMLDQDPKLFGKGLLKRQDVSGIVVDDYEIGHVLTDIREAKQFYETACITARDHGKILFARCQNPEVIKNNKDKLSPLLFYNQHSGIFSEEAQQSSIAHFVMLSHRIGNVLYLQTVSNESSLRYLKQVTRKNVFIETNPQYLFLNIEDYLNKKGYAQFIPAIREKEHNSYVASKMDSLIDTLASDHLIRNRENEMKYDIGNSGNSTITALLPLALETVIRGNISLRRMQQMISETPARVLGLENVGRIETGQRADLVVVDLNAKTTFDDGTFEGITVHSAVSATFLKGKMISWR